MSEVKTENIMRQLSWKAGELFLEGMNINDIARDVDTPTFVYSKAHITEQYKSFFNAFSDFNPIIAYAFKANANLELLKLLASMGCGADVVSGGELLLALMSGFPPAKIVFNGNGKIRAEIDLAIEYDILQFNADLYEEAELINEIAGKQGKRARIAFRVNPDIDPKTHPYITTGLKNSKFGISYKDAIETYKRAAELENIDIVGIHMHLGSQMTDISPLIEGVEKMAALIKQLRANGIALKYFDLGGGIGITYKDEQPPTPADYAKSIGAALKDLNITPIFEPGRYIVGNSGILLANVLYVKNNGYKNFVVADAAMNDLIRPAFYGAYHHIINTREKAGTSISADVVGPICESGDFLGKDREFTGIAPGDNIAVLSAGAYGFSMASTYNGRLRPAEVLVDKDNYSVIRHRQKIDTLAGCP